MNKAETIEAVAKAASVSKAVAAGVIDAFIGTVAGTVASGDEVAITGFGAWKPVKRAAREGRNPITGDKIKVPARVAVKFTPGKALKDAVASGKKKAKK